MEARYYFSYYCLDDNNPCRYYTVAVWYAISMFSGTEQYVHETVINMSTELNKEQKEKLEVVVDGTLGATSGAAIGAIGSGLAYHLTGGALGLALPIAG